jgi:hypothetical protein
MKKYKPKSGEKIEIKEEIIPPKVELPFEFSKEHNPVMVQEILAAFFPFRQKPGVKYFDGTFGRGGHYTAVKHTIPHMQATVMDQDLVAVEFAKTRFQTEVQKNDLKVLHGNFAQFSEQNLGSFDMMLLDLGVSSPQLDQADRGFSFYHDGPLDMRMNQQQGLTAEVIVNTASEEDVNVVNAPEFGVVLPIAGGDIKLNVPPKVKFPEVVTVPVKVKPLTVPVPLTDVTVPLDAVADNVPVVNESPVPIVTELKPPLPLP